MQCVMCSIILASCDVAVYLADCFRRERSVEMSGAIITN